MSTPIREAVKIEKPELPSADDILANMSVEKKSALMNAAKVIATTGHKSKTIIFAYLVIIFGIGQELLPQIQEYVSGDLYGYITSGIGFIMIVLRYITSASLQDK